MKETPKDQQISCTIKPPLNKKNCPQTLGEGDTLQPPKKKQIRSRPTNLGGRCLDRRLTSYSYEPTTLAKGGIQMDTLLPSKKKQLCPDGRLRSYSYEPPNPKRAHNPWWKAMSRWTLYYLLKRNRDIQVDAQDPILISPQT